MPDEIWEASPFIWCILFFLFFLHVHIFDDVRFHYTQIIIIMSLLVSHVEVFSSEISLFVAWNIRIDVFLSIIVDLLILVSFVLFLVAVTCLSLLFLRSPRVLVLLLSFKCWRLFFLLFLRHIVCLCHLFDVTPYASSLYFLFSGPFFKLLSLSISRMVPSIKQEDITEVHTFHETSAEELGFMTSFFLPFVS